MPVATRCSVERKIVFATLSNGQFLRDCSRVTIFVPEAVVIENFRIYEANLTTYVGDDNLA